jgi:4,5-DOPA dioxygenase extradiol
VWLAADFAAGTLQRRRTRRAAALNASRRRPCSNAGMNTLPSLYLSHGSPMIALQPRAAGHFMQRLGPAISATFGRPIAVLMISAHTLAREPVPWAAPRHEAIYDFSGFDPKLHTLRYDAPGAPALAGRVAGLLEAAGVPAHTSDRGGLDHGIWTPLRYVFPDADIPVLPLAWPPDASPAQLFALGAALAPLADEGVLIIGSGSLTHNLRMVFGAGTMPSIDAPEIAESGAFRRWVLERSSAADWPALFDYRRQAPHAALMHPSDEHWLPFYPAAGAAGALPMAVRLHESIDFGCLAMDAYAFGPQAPRLQQALQAGP